MKTLLFLFSMMWSCMLYADSELDCLAKNIYFEARNQSVSGMLAVGKVTMNRVASKLFPNTICKVVKQRTKQRCEFSWYCDGKSDVPYNKDKYQQAKLIAESLLVANPFIVDPTNGALFYHADYIRGSWFKRNLIFVAKIDNHLFYTTN